MFKVGFLLALGFYCAKTIFVIVGDVCSRLAKRLEEAGPKTKKKEADAQKPKEAKKTGRIVVSGFGREL